MPAAAPTFNDSIDPCIGMEIDLVDFEIISAFIPPPSLPKIRIKSSGISSS
tara:strand:- start:69 stop:221 length:153 start_codon:yes stop_codon:yes gene_type:complete